MVVRFFVSSYLTRCCVLKCSICICLFEKFWRISLKYRMYEYVCVWVLDFIIDCAIGYLIHRVKMVVRFFVFDTMLCVEVFDMYVYVSLRNFGEFL